MRFSAAILLISLVAAGCGKSSSPEVSPPSGAVPPVSKPVAATESPGKKTAHETRPAAEEGSPFQVIEEKRH